MQDELEELEDEDWDDEELEEDEPQERGGDGSEAFGAFAQSSASLGLLALVPFLVAYEWAQGRGEPRHSAEALLFLAPETILGGEVLRWLRPLALGGLVVAALTLCYRRRQALFPGVLRVWIEGALFALVFGPLLAWIARLAELALPEPTPAGGMPLTQAAGLLGGAAYEEFLFRVLGYGLFYLLTLRVVRFLGARRGWARGLSDGTALLLSAGLFAAFHLEVCIGWLGGAGEAFDAGVFTWRFLAGCLLGALFRLRGVGVAACAHAFYNWALMLDVPGT